MSTFSHHDGKFCVSIEENQEVTKQAIKSLRKTLSSVLSLEHTPAKSEYGLGDDQSTIKHPEVKLTEEQDLAYIGYEL